MSFFPTASLGIGLHLCFGIVNLKLHDINRCGMLQCNVKFCTEVNLQTSWEIRVGVVIEEARAQQQTAAVVPMINTLQL